MTERAPGPRRSVLVGLPSGVGHRSAIETAAELARLFGRPLAGLYVEETASLDLSVFAGGRTDTSPGRVRRDARMMRVAVTREGDRARATLETLAVATRIEVSFATRQGGLVEAVAEAAGEGDLVVVPLDLAERRIAPLIARTGALAAHAAGVLLVPECRPARTGAVLAIAPREPAGADPVGLAAEIAGGLGAGLVVLVPDGDPAALAAAWEAAAGPDRPSPEVRRVPADHPLAVEDCGARAVRLIVASAGDAALVNADAPEGPLRRFRAALLIAGGDGGDATG